MALTQHVRTQHAVAKNKAVKGRHNEMLPSCLLNLNTPRKKQLMQQLNEKNFHYDVDVTRIKDQPVKTIMSIKDPQIYAYADFLSQQECDILVAMAKKELEESTTVCNDTGARQRSDHRTSQSAFFPRQHGATITALEKRIQLLLDYPINRGEDLHIARYGLGQEYRAHYDYFDPACPGSKEHLRDGGQRFATVLMYLNDVEAGGATAFPKLGLDFMPKKGHALLFIYCDAAGVIDPRSLHAGCPVLAGEKWIATKWIRLGPHR